MPRPAVRTVQSRALALLAIGALALAGCGSSSSSTSTSSAASTPTASTPATTAQQPATPGAVTASSGALTATLIASGHSPKVNAAWPIHVTATESGQPASATIVYEYLYGGAVVAHRSHYTFTGHFTDTLRWPASAVGYPLTFRAVITSAGATVNLDYPVQVSG